ncbi:MULTISPECIES: hypothetical protein [Methylobacterium]|jgi:hypothetical protein|uniref:Uncharacterized protein n=1 Tax=Methylobacterium jeotgali TaxID=381630 RepID=A0ABQ4T299_9HYPH|nr:MULTISPECIES: hypothetical protein [Methylobacterium]GBU16830.1 hypothetical protein AwMethylo_10450 [Methylobacterium sp.]GJE08375.1 hypothetical protein AOPFMNJM_3712 [Methylobacterium jeotgali]
MPQKPPSLVTLDPSGLMERRVNERPLIRHLVRVAGYLGIGALVHAWFLGPQFEQGNLWSWGYLFAWPVPLLFWVVASILIFLCYAGLLVGTCALVWWFVVTVVESRWRSGR